MANSVKSNYYGKSREYEFTVTARILSKYENIKSIAADCADISEYKTECSSGRLFITGRVNFKLIANDGEAGVVALNYNVDFDEKAEADFITPESVVMGEISVQEVRVNVLGGNEAEVSAKCRFLFTEILSEETEMLPVSEAVLTKKEAFSIGRLQVCPQKDFAVTREIPVSSEKGILQADASAVITQTYVQDGVLTVKGTAYLQVISLSSEDLPQVTLISIDFDEETDAGSFTGNSVPMVRIKPVGTRIRINSDEERSVTQAEMTFRLFVYAMHEDITECIVDDYSTTHNTESRYEDIHGISYYGMTTAQIGFSGRAECDTPVARALGLYNGKAVVTQAEAGEGNVRISGMVTGNFIYLDGDDRLSSNRFVLPFAAIVNVPEARQEMRVSADAVVTDAAVKRNGAGADIAGTVTVNLYLTHNTTARVIAEVTVGEEKIRSDAAIEVVIAGVGDDLWSIGKSLEMNPDELLAVNPELKEPLCEQTRVVVYRHL